MIAPAPASRQAPASLGGFALERLVGQGGMADVWLGRHGIEGQPAAIKVITRHMADDEQYREGLRREVRAVAGLDHPNIVPVFDTGTVDDAAAEASGGALVAGSPWLAMHYAEHGELRRLPHPMPWPLLREVLLQILDGLAHAHARGVVHRDLKPENVLLHIERERLRLMLTDFGIAHVVDAQQTEGGASANSAGTPHYMAPEQFKGQWRDYGPWTDLYALGCMAFELATGHPPFTDNNLFGIAHKHLTAEVPALRTAEPMPVGFEAWIGRMMRRDPHQRYQSAADAAWALGRLTVPDAEATRAARLAALDRLGASAGGQATEVSSPQGVALAETQAYAESDGMGYTLASVVGVGGHLPALAVAARAPAPTAEGLPPMPETWFVDTPERPLLRGVGLGLFGVRAMPFVDRDAERDTLWDALRDVRAQGHARLVILRGTEGSGKSRLARWFARRASEVGAAEHLEVRHSPMDAPGDAVAAAIDGWFRGAGLERPALQRRIAQRMAALDPERRDEIEAVHAPALARFVRPDGDRMGGQLTPRERFGAVHGWLHALSRRRPVVIHFDDIQWCDDTVGLLEWMLTQAGSLPVLMVATLRTDLCKGGTFGAKALGRLAEHPRAEPLTIGPLSPPDHRRVVGDLLGLHPMLAEQLLGRTDGNPLFAEQIIADWIERRALMPTELGYMCNGTALVDVPPDLRTLALRRVDRLAARFADGEAVQIALDAAAVLGHAVRIDEWKAVFTAVAGRPALPEGLIDALYDTGLAAADRGGWVFGHGFVRDALLERACGGARWRALHLAAAETVRGGRAPGERRARHLMFAGEKDAAMAALLDAARCRMDASEYRRAVDICDWRLTLMDKIGLPPDDVRRAEGLPVRVEALRFMGHIDEAEALLTRFRRFPFGAGQPFLLAEAERLRGGQAQFEGRVDEMSDAYRRAIELYRAAGDRRGEVRSRHGLGWSLIHQGRLDAAERAFLASGALARQAGLTLDEAWAVQGIGSARMFAERADAGEPLERALTLFEGLHAPVGVASSRLFLAEVYRQRDDHGEALRLARSAHEIGRLVGSHMRYLARYIVGMVHLDMGDAAVTRQVLAELRSQGAIDRIQRQYGPSMRVVFAWLALADGELARVDEIGAEIVATRGRTFMHPHARRVLGELAEALERRGESRRAATWWALAADFHRRIAPAKADAFDARARAAAR